MVCSGYNFEPLHITFSFFRKFFFWQTHSHVLFWWLLLFVSKPEWVLPYWLLQRHINPMYIPWDPPLVLHLLTSWQPALQPVTSPLPSAEVGVGSESNGAITRKRRRTCYHCASDPAIHKNFIFDMDGIFLPYLYQVWVSRPLGQGQGHMQKWSFMIYFNLLFLCMWLKLINKAKVIHQDQGQIKVTVRERNSNTGGLHFSQMLSGCNKLCLNICFQICEGIYWIARFSSETWQPKLLKLRNRHGNCKFQMFQGMGNT